MQEAHREKNYYASCFRFSRNVCSRQHGRAIKSMGFGGGQTLARQCGNSNFSLWMLSSILQSGEIISSWNVCIAFLKSLFIYSTNLNKHLEFVRHRTNNFNRVFSIWVWHNPWTESPYLWHFFVFSHSSLNLTGCPQILVNEIVWFGASKYIWDKARKIRRDDRNY